MVEPNLKNWDNDSINGQKRIYRFVQQFSVSFQILFNFRIFVIMYVKTRFTNNADVFYPKHFVSCISKYKVLKLFFSVSCDRAFYIFDKKTLKMNLRFQNFHAVQ
jgi:hypothetical protein